MFNCIYFPWIWSIIVFQVSITLESSETINRRFAHPSRRNSLTITKVDSWIWVMIPPWFSVELMSWINRLICFSWSHFGCMNLRVTTFLNYRNCYKLWYLNQHLLSWTMVFLVFILVIGKWVYYWHHLIISTKVLHQSTKGE